MSIADEIQDLNTNLQAAKSAVTAKGGTVGDTGLAGLSTEIATIPIPVTYDYGTVTVCSYTYTGSVNDSSSCTVTINDADEFFENALEKGWLYVSTDDGDIIGQVDFQYQIGGWYTQDDYDTKYTTEYLNQLGITVALDSGATWASFAIRFVFTFNTNNTTQLHITEKVDFLSLGYLNTKYSEYGDMGDRMMSSTFTFNDSLYLKAQIVSYVSGTDVTKTPDCFLAGSYNLSSVSITGVAEIGPYFLYNCIEFDSPITIPSTVTKIGSYFMSGCESFDQAITFPATVTEIGRSCLYGCVSLDSQVTVLGPVTSLESFMTSCSAYNQPFTIPSTLTRINELLANCDAFNQPITIPNGVTEIATLLSDCKSFNQPITIPASVTRITNFPHGMSAFNSTVTFSEGLVEIAHGCFYMCSAFNKPISLPSTVKSIGESFLYNSAVFNSTLNLGSVKTIGNDFMNGCRAFNQNITIPSTVTTISYAQFMFNCNAMTSTVTVNTSFTPSSNNYAMATQSSSAACYTTGIKVGGTNGAAWRTAWPNKTSVPYRKLIAA